MQSALGLLPSIGSSANVAVSLSTGGVYTVSFIGALAGSDMQTITGDPSGLNAGSTIAGATTTHGGPTANVGADVTVSGTSALVIDTSINGNLSINKGLVLGGTGNASSGALRMIVGSNTNSTAATWSAPIAMNANATIGVSGSSNTLTLTGNISGVNFVPTKILPGTLVFAGTTANTYGNASIATVVNEGTLLLNKTAGLDAIPAGLLTIGNEFGGPQSDIVELLAAGQIDQNNQVTVSSSGWLNLNGNSQTLGAALTLNFDASYAAQLTTGAGTLTMQGNVTATQLGGEENLASPAAVISGNLSLDGVARTFTVNAPSTGNEFYSLDIQANIVQPGTSGGSLIKAGAGTLRIFSNNASNYTGVTTLSAGILDITSGGSLGSGPIVAAGGGLRADSSAVTISNPIQLGTGGLTVNGNQNLTFTNTVTQLPAASSITVNNTGATSFSPALPNVGLDATQTITFAGGASINGGTFTLSFDGNTTNSISNPLTFAATAAQVQAALQALPNMTNNVLVSGSAGSYVVTFVNQLANAAMPLIVANSLLTSTAGASTYIAVDQTLAGAGNTTEQLSFYAASAPSSGSFTLSVNGVPTTTLNSSSTPANIQAAIGALVGTSNVLVLGPSTVGSSSNASYTIVFEGALAGTSAPLAVETIGSNTLVPTTTITASNVSGVGSLFDSIQTIAFPGAIGPVVFGGTFTLSFAGQTTNPIPYNATAAQVQAALVGLSNIGFGTNANNVEVSGSNGYFTVTFIGALADAPLPTITAVGTSLNPSGTITTASLVTGYGNTVQQVAFTGTGATGGSFSLTFGGQTASQSTAATALTIQSALQSLTNIGTNNVIVLGPAITSTNPTYTIIFEGILANGNLPALTVSSDSLTSGTAYSSTVSSPGIGFGNGVQTLNLVGNITTSGSYQLSFGGQTATISQANASATAVQAALQGLSTIGAGNVLVLGATPGSSGGSFTIDFTGALAGTSVPLMTAGSASLAAGTSLAINTVAAGAAASTLSLNLDNAITTITTNANTNTSITGVIADAVTGTNGLTKAGIGPLTLGGTNTFDGPKLINAGIVNVTNGSALGAAVNSVQTLSFNAAASGGVYTLTYNGVATATIAAAATSASVQAALQAISTIGGVAGGLVTVTGGSATAGTPLVITLGGTLAGTQFAISANSASLSGATASVATLVTGTGAATVTANAAIQVSGNISVPEPVILAGSASPSGFNGVPTGLLRSIGGSVSGSNTWSGPISLSGTGTIVAIGADAQSSLFATNTIGTFVGSSVAQSVSLTKVGAGALEFDGTTANVYSGTTTVIQGTLTLNKTATQVGTAGTALGTGSLVVGDDIGGSQVDVVRYGASAAAGQIGTATSNNVTVTSSGLLDLASNSQSATIGGTLTLNVGRVNSAQINLGSGTLTLNGNVIENSFGPTDGTSPAAQISATTGGVSLSNALHTITLSDTLAPSPNEDLIIGAKITGAGASSAITLAGTGTMALTGTASYNGATTLGAGSELNLRGAGSDIHSTFSVALAQFCNSTTAAARSAAPIA